MLKFALTLLLLGFKVVAAPPLAPKPPATMAVSAELLTPLSSYHSRHGDAVEAMITTPVCVDGAPLAQSTLEGVVKRVHSVGLGLLHETASLTIDLQTLRLAGGELYPIEARLTSIDNARERVDRHGVIHGIRATDSISSRAASHLFFYAHVHPALIIPSLAVESWFFHFPEPEFDYAPGTEMEVEVSFPPSLGAVAACPQPAPAPEDVAAWQNLVDGLPAWTYSKRQPQPMDPVNLLFLAPLASLERAFRAAGWTGSQPNSVRTGFKAIRAIAEDRSYADAPMRTLLLDGQPADLRIQRSLNTFDKRDHMRIWQRDEDWQGREVWAAAAIQDLAATFSTHHPFGFTHRIQTDVDIERDKIVRELEFTGCVDSVVRTQRPPDAVGTEARKGLETDSRVAVVLLNSCEHPRELPMPAAQAAADKSAEPPVETRIIRRFTLTARNHFMRDNLFWRSGEMLRYGWHEFRDWETERKQKRLARM